MRRIFCVFLLMLLVLSSFSPAWAENTYPVCQGKVTDLANVLGEDTVRDLTELSGRMESAAGGSLYIVTRHFLGGADAAAYADGLFSAWGLKEKDALLLLVIGEEDYALSLGESVRAALPDETRISLLGARLRTPFLSREYDAALADFSLSYAAQMEKIFGVKIASDGLLGREALRSTPAPRSLSQLWADVFGDQDENENAVFHADDEEGVSWRTIVIWALLIYFFFFRKKKAKRNRFWR